MEEAILDAAWTVLVDTGYSGFTYEAIAARAKTSRPVLYRRWPKRPDLLIATVTRAWHAEPLEVPDTGNIRDDALALLRNANAGRAYLFTLLSVQLTDYFRDTGSSFDELRDALVPTGERPGFEVLIERAVSRGEIPDHHRTARVVNLPLDLLRHDMLMSMRAVPDASLVEIVDEIWLPLIASDGAATRTRRRAGRQRR